MPEKEIIAKKVKALRKNQKENQFEFAANIGISIEELSLLERELANPCLQTLQKIAAYTGNTVAELLKQDDPEVFQKLLNAYFNSEEYNSTANGEKYQTLIQSLQYCINNGYFLDIEEQLNELIINVAEKSYKAGYTKASENNNL